MNDNPMTQRYRVALLDTCDANCYGANQAMLRTMTTQLIKHERLKTTWAKAMELRRPAEKMITLAKKATEHSRKGAQAWVQEDAVLPKLFDELGPRFAGRQGGYTRVLKAGYRHGDNAPMAYIEYVDNELPPLRAPTEKRTKEDAIAGHKVTARVLKAKRIAAQNANKEALSSHFPRRRGPDHHRKNPMASAERI